MPLPYYINRKSLLEHAIIRGSTGSGKTAMILAPLTEQLIRHAAQKQDSSVLVIDLKGDPAFFHGVRKTATASGLPFRFFTLTRNRASHAMNPFLQSHFVEHLTTSQQASMFAKTMGLDHGEFYGATFFRDIALLFLRAVLKFDDVDSFSKLAAYVTEHPQLIKVHPKVKDDTTHLAAILDDLAAIKPLNVLPESDDPAVIENMIDMPSLLQSPHVVYFYLSSIIQPHLSDIVAKLAAFLLLTAASVMDNKKSKRVYVIVDEFQRIVSNEFCIFLQQARSLGVGCILANQTTGDLKTPSGDFRHTVEENTNIKIDLSANSREQALRLIDESPEVIAWQTSFSDGVDPTISQVPQKLLNQNDLQAMSARQNQGLIRVRNAIGYTQLAGQQVPFTTGFHITNDEYHHRAQSSWPTINDVPGTLPNDYSLPSDLFGNDDPDKPKAETKVPAKPKEARRRKKADKKPSPGKKPAYDSRAKQLKRDAQDRDAI